MIAKCIAILAIVAQINANVCQQRALISTNIGSSSVVAAPIAAAPIAAAPIAAAPIAAAPIAAAPVASVGIQSSGISGLGSASASGSGAITKNIVAKGKYPVALSNCGPTPDRQIPVTFSQSTAPVQEKPTVRLPARIPEQRTIAHTCTCYKTIVKPRVHNHVVTVPSVERYIETGHTPIIENIHYEAEPVNCRNEADKFYFVNANGQGLLQGQTLGSSLVSQSAQLLSASPAQQVLVQSQAPQSVELLSAPIRPAVEVVSAPIRQAPQMIALPASPAVQSVEVVSAPIRPAVQAVEVLSAPVRQASQMIAVPARPAVQVVSSAPALQVSNNQCYGF